MVGQLKYFLLLGLLFCLAAGVGVGVMLWPRLRNSIPKPVVNPPVQTEGSYRDIIFLHHSTGRLLIAEGHMRPLLTELGYRFWDHGYNFEGLVQPDGVRLWGHYDIPGEAWGGNTDVDGLAALFAQPLTDPPGNAFSRLLQHEVIVFKSCFTNSEIPSNTALEQLKADYLKIRAVIDQHPDRLFILLTTPPLHPLETNLPEAARARAIAAWLTSEAFAGDRPNLVVFDFFDQLADPQTNMLRADYQINLSGVDSHPNEQANQVIGPRLVKFIDEAVKNYTQAY